MKQKFLTIAFAVLVFAIPVLSIVNGQPLTQMLKDLQGELQMTQLVSDKEQQLFDDDYNQQHDRMLEIITNSNRLSILLYTQDQEMTFDLAYALRKVSSAYEDFNKERRPYDHIVKGLSVEIDRYARLIEALRRLPPVKHEIEIEIVPDSLLYHNDSLELHLAGNESFLEKEVIRISIKDSLSSPIVLDEEGERYRDSCIRYASVLLKRYADNRALMIADSTHYQEAYWRVKEAYDYAQTRYDDLEKYVFSEGLTPFMNILRKPREHWEKMALDMHQQYDFSQIRSDSEPQDDDADLFEGLSSKGANSTLVIVCFLQILFLLFFWILTFFGLKLGFRIFKHKKPFINKKQLPLFSLLAGTFLYFLILGLGVNADLNEYIRLSARHINTFLWLLMAISGSLLLRVKADQLWRGFRLYIPAVVMALFIIVCRITFVPDRLVNMLFPPILAFVVLRQLFFCIRDHGKATSLDSILGWISLGIYVIAFGLAFAGFTFAAILDLVWWYFQLAVLLSIFCLVDLLGRYKVNQLNEKVNAMRERITFVTGPDRESLLFGAKWFYELVRNVVIPALLLLSLPFCIHLSLNVFEFDDLFAKLYSNPFVQLFDKDNVETFHMSVKSIVDLLILFFVLRYVNQALHAIWQYLRYTAFMRKHNRTTVRENEINLSLGNSILSVLIWMIYLVVVVDVLGIPTGSLTLVAGGLSAGIGLALKDIINNFIYGIQLMGGRLRVGDWIECDGVRGRVVAINYQCVVVETVEGTEMSFLNASLFGKNFNNLTRNNSYEFTKIVVGVAYGSDVRKVREVLMEAMQKMRTKDRYGREIVDMSQYGGDGFSVVVNEMADSAVEIAVKQYVLVPERISYVDRSKEIIYEALNAAGITIAFPQCDVHLIHDDE